MKAPGSKLSVWAKRVKAEVELRARQKPTALLESLGKGGPKPPPLERALRSSSPSLVVELRRKDASGAWLDRELEMGEASAEAKSGGAAALFVPTDGGLHGAIDGDLPRARTAGLPIVRYEVIVHRHQLAEARVAGASGVTLHAALHETKEIAAFLKVGVELGLSVVPLVSTLDECHTILDLGAPLVCVSLSDDDDEDAVDGRAEALVPVLAKAGTLVIARGGVHSADDVARLARLGAESVVVAGPFVRAGDRAAFLRTMRPASP